MSARSISSVLLLLQQVGPYNEVPEDYNSSDAAHDLTSAKILVIGAGGLGCEILKNLALTGFRDIHVIDMDTIDVSNLNRQFLFRASDVGNSKAETAARFVEKRINDPCISITPHFCRIQDKPDSFYQQFNLVICGLDSVEARRWINATLVSFVDGELNGIIPLVDGGTEGFRGQSRVILPTITSCYECTLDLVTPKTTYPVCTIANTPRLPEHCIEWANILEWPRKFPHASFDPDDPSDVDTMYALALARANEFKIRGVTRQLTLGVVKNIIPAIASTNAIIAASCCNEAFKIITNVNPALNNYMMYSGDDSIFTYTYAQSKKANCPVCGNQLKTVVAKNWWTLRDLIDDIVNKPDVQMKNPSLATKTSNLYLTAPAELEVLTRNNLDIKVGTLVRIGEEIVVTDPGLPISLKITISAFEGSHTRPSDINTLLMA